MPAAPTHPPTHLGAGGSEDAGRLPHQSPLLPQGAGGIKEGRHLGGRPAKPAGSRGADGQQGGSDQAGGAQVCGGRQEASEAVVPGWCRAGQTLRVGASETKPSKLRQSVQASSAWVQGRLPLVAHSTTEGTFGGAWGVVRCFHSPRGDAEDKAVEVGQLTHCDLRHVALGGGMQLLQHLSRQGLRDLWQAGKQVGRVGHGGVLFGALRCPKGEGRVRGILLTTRI